MGPFVITDIDAAAAAMERELRRTETLIMADYEAWIEEQAAALDGESDESEAA